MHYDVHLDCSILSYCIKTCSARLNNIGSRHDDATMLKGMYGNMLAMNIVLVAGICLQYMSMYPFLHICRLISFLTQTFNTSDWRLFRIHLNLCSLGDALRHRYTVPLILARIGHRTWISSQFMASVERTEISCSVHTRTQICGVVENSSSNGGNLQARISAWDNYHSNRLCFLRKTSSTTQTQDAANSIDARFLPSRPLVDLVRGDSQPGLDPFVERSTMLVYMIHLHVFVHTGDSSMELTLGVKQMRVNK